MNLPNPQNAIDCIAKAHECVTEYVMSVMDAAPDVEPDIDLYHLIVYLETVKKKLEEKGALAPFKPLKPCNHKH